MGRPTRPDGRAGRPVPLATVVWREERSQERFTLLRDGAEHELEGTVVSAEGGPWELRYAVRAAADWRTASAAVDALTPAGPWNLRLESRGGRWTVDGKERPDLEGCLDVDLGFTPATNTLPIRRLGLELGASAQIDVAWLLFPELRVERAAQRYEHLGPGRYRYRQDDYAAVIEVDGLGIVREYEGLWREVARA
jgi:hypothetical protein